MEHTIYLICAVAGCGLLLLQIVLQLFGLVEDASTDAVDAHGHFDTAGPDAHHVGGNWFFGVLSFKALVAFAGVFGLTGLALEGTEMAVGWRVSFAIEAGIVAMLLIAYLMRTLHGLYESGTVNLQAAKGREAIVYLRIPGNRSGQGKITVEIDGRAVEMPAMTSGEELPTGARARVLAVTEDGTATVEAV